MARKYYENLPRKVRTTIKCQVLNDDGVRCKEKAYYEVDAHLDNEVYTDWDGAQWVSLLVCKSHFNATWVWVNRYDKKKYIS